MSTTIAFVHKDFPAGGAEAITAGISRFFLDKGDRVIIFVSNLDKAKVTEYHSGIEFIQLPDSDYDSIENAKFIVGNVAELNIAIVIFPISILKMMKYVRDESGAKVIFSLHSVPMWEVEGTVSRRKRKAYRKGPIDILLWHIFKYPFIKLFNNPNRRFLKKYRFAYENSDAFTVLVDEYKVQVEKLLDLDPRDNHVYVTPNFIPHKEYDQTAEKEKIVLFVGRIDYYDKRIDRLIDIWNKIYAKFPQWQLWIVGEGPERKFLENNVRQRGIGNVRFLPYNNYPSEYYQKASIVALTSQFEGWPMVIAEAQQAGAVPIAFGCTGGIVDQIGSEDEYGVLVPPFDKEIYRGKLINLMENQRARDEIGQNARRKADTYSRELPCKIWDGLFEKLLK